MGDTPGPHVETYALWKKYSELSDAITQIVTHRQRQRSQVLYPEIVRRLVLGCLEKTTGR